MLIAQPSPETRLFLLMVKTDAACPEDISQPSIKDSRRLFPTCLNESAKEFAVSCDDHVAIGV